MNTKIRLLIVWCLISIPVIIRSFNVALFVNIPNDTIVVTIILTMITVCLSKKNGYKDSLLEKPTLLFILIGYSVLSSILISMITVDSYTRFIGYDGGFLLLYPLTIFYYLHPLLFIIYIFRILWQTIKNSTSSLALKISPPFVIILSLIFSVYNIFSTTSLFQNTGVVKIIYFFMYPVNLILSFIYKMSWFHNAYVGTFIERMFPLILAYTLVGVIMYLIFYTLNALFRNHTTKRETS